MFYHVSFHDYVLCSPTTQKLSVCPQPPEILFGLSYHAPRVHGPWYGILYVDEGNLFSNLLCQHLQELHLLSEKLFLYINTCQY